MWVRSRAALGCAVLGVALAVAPASAPSAAAVAASEVTLTVQAYPAEVTPGGQVRFAALLLLPHERVTVSSLTSASLGDLADEANPDLVTTGCELPALVGPDDSYGAYDFGCDYVTLLSVPAGAWTDTVTAVVRRADATEVRVTAGVVVSVDEGLGALVGSITDDVTGQPISAVPVLVVGAAGLDRTARSDAVGRYGVYDLPAGDYSVTAGNGVSLESSAYAPEWYRDKDSRAAADPVTVAAGGTATADLQLARGGRVTGRVTDAVTGDPVAGAEVSHRGPMGGPMGGFTTDADGRYTITGLVTGTYEVCAYLGGYSQGCVDDVAVTVRETTDDVDLELARESTAELGVAVEIVGTAFVGGPATARILVDNVGADPVTDVQVDPESEGCSAAVSGPSVDVGDTDAVLEPGESWSYTCGRTNVVVGVVRVHVTATDTGGALVEADGHLLFDLLDPVTVAVAPSATSVPAGTTVDWVIDVRNIGNYALVGVRAEGRVLYPEWQGPVPYHPAAGPESVSGDGDGLFEPGETERFTLSLPVTEQGSYLDVTATAAPADSPGTGLAFAGRSAVVTVTPAPDGSELPDTGAGGYLGALLPLGGGLVLAGAGLLAVSRRV